MADNTNPAQRTLGHYHARDADTLDMPLEQYMAHHERTVGLRVVDEMIRQTAGDQLQADLRAALRALERGTHPHTVAAWLADRLANGR